MTSALIHRAEDMDPWMMGREGASPQSSPQGNHEKNTRPTPAQPGTSYMTCGQGSSALSRSSETSKSPKPSQPEVPKETG